MVRGEGADPRQRLSLWGPELAAFLRWGLRAGAGGREAGTPGQGPAALLQGRAARPATPPTPGTSAATLALQTFPAGSYRAQEAMFW